jgi:hypothetical protein
MVKKQPKQAVKTGGPNERSKGARSIGLNGRKAVNNGAGKLQPDVPFRSRVQNKRSKQTVKKK